jgi:MFS family permease
VSESQQIPPSNRADSAPNGAPRNVYAFGLTSFLNDTASEMAYWVLPAFIASLGAGPAQLGVIEGIAESVASFAKLFSGYLADRLSRRKPVVVGGYVVANAVKPLLALVTSWWQILGIRFADRAAKGMRGAARDVMVAESVDASRLGSAYGLIQALDSAGAILGPLAALALMAHYGARGVFAAAAVPGALCILVAVFGIRETRMRTVPGVAAAAPIPAGHHAKTTADVSLDANRQSRWVTALPAGYYYILTVVALFSLANSSDMFLVLRAVDVGVPASRAPLLGLIFNITYTLASWPAGKFSDHFSRSAIAAAGYFVFAIVYFVFAAAVSSATIWPAMAFYGLFYALSTPTLKALVVETVSPEVRGRALGVYFFVTSVTTLLASLITGALWKTWGARVPFYVSAVIAGVSAAALLAHRSPARPTA